MMSVGSLLFCPSWCFHQQVKLVNLIFLYSVRLLVKKNTNKGCEDCNIALPTTNN